jgi:hypothetical protein
VTDLRQPDGPAPASQPSACPEQDLVARVTLVRTDARDAQQRQVLARVDDGPTATLMFGDRQTIDVAPGRHLLKVNNTLVWKRMPFAIEPGEHLEFQLINRPGRLTLGFLALLGVAPLFLSIEQRPPSTPAPART